MRVDLPSGAYVDLREKLKGRDRVRAQAAVKLLINEDGTQAATGDVGDQIAIALLIEMITAWSFEGVPVPSQQATDDNAVTVLEDLDLDDFKALVDAIGPYIEKVQPNNPNRQKRRN